MEKRTISDCEVEKETRRSSLEVEKDSNKNLEVEVEAMPSLEVESDPSVCESLQRIRHCADVEADNGDAGEKLQQVQ